MSHEDILKSLRKEVPVLDEATHTYTVTRPGVAIKVPAVSDMTAMLGSYDGIDPRVLNAAAERGTSAHKAIMLWQESQWEPELRDQPHVAAWQTFFKNHPLFEVVAMELPVFHPVLMYAGTLDCLVYDKYYSQYRIIDIKSGSTEVPTSWTAQVGLYRIAVERITGLTLGKSIILMTQKERYTTLNANDALCYALVQLHREKQKGDPFKWNRI